MNFISFKKEKCNLCGKCIDTCPFGVLGMGENSIEVGENCRMCGVCVRNCPNDAIYFEQKAKSVDKNAWRDFLIYVEQERGEIHPVALELIGEAKKMAEKVNYKVKCVIVGPLGTTENGRKLLQYGVDEVFVYEDPGFEGFKVDCYTDAVADCISEMKPSSVLIGATSLGRSLAPRLATRFHTGLTADCTTLDIMPNSDMLQIRPAFGGNIMAQILIANSRPQFATVRYRIMDAAKQVEQPTGVLTLREIPERMTRSRIEVISSELLAKKERIEDAEVIVAIGRGVKDEEGVKLCRSLAEALGGTLAYTRPMVEMGIGDQLHQIGLSGHTVRPKLIITVGVSGAIQFTSCMNSADTIVAINNDPAAQIFDTAGYCICEDLYEVVPRLIDEIQNIKEAR